MLFSIIFLLAFYLQKIVVTYQSDKQLMVRSKEIKKTLMSHFLPSTFSALEVESLISDDVPTIIMNEHKAVLYYNSEYLMNLFNIYGMNRLVVSRETHYLSAKTIRIGIFPFDFYGKNYYIIVDQDISGNSVLLHNLTLYILAVFLILFLTAYFLYATEHERYVSEIKGITRSVRKIRNDNLFFRIDSHYYEKGISDLAQTFNEMLERIEMSFNRVQQFTSDVSHELRTPIASIKNMIEVELSAERSKEEYEEILIKVVEEINWLGTMVTDLLMLENLSASNLEKEPINLRQMVEQVAELLSVLTVDKNIELRVNIHDNVMVYGDKNKLRRVVMNLISNAIKYNVENGSIFISALMYKKGVLLEVEDTGIGIKKENIPKIFHRFFREDKVRTTKKEGLGLGLAMVKHILNLHGAEVTVQSMEGKGTKFSIVFKNDTDTKNKEEEENEF